VNVGGSEAQKPEPGVEQPVLPAIVFDQAIAVVGPGVLENEPCGGVVQVGPACETILAVIEIRLHIWARQAALDEKPSKAGLHWRFGWRRKRRKGTQPSRTGAAGCGVGVPTKRAATFVKRPCSAMSIAIRTSTAGHARHRSQRARCKVKARSPRTVIDSDAGIWQ
jgi:hypothetical protein